MEYTHLRRSVAPATEPVSLDELKLHARVDHNDEDGVLAALIPAARGYLEDFTGSALIAQTWVAQYRAFPSALHLPRAPLLDVTGITYLDAAGETQTLAADQYRVTGAGAEGVIEPPPGVNWPATYGTRDAVTVTYRAGWGASAETVPEPARLAVLLLAASFYDNRSAFDFALSGGFVELPIGIRALMAQYRSWLP